MVESRLLNIMQTYQQSFADKVYQEENDDIDPLMDAFGLTSASKRENRQYWGRELGMCWQMLVSHVLETHGQNYRPAFRIGQDEPCDMIIRHYAIDTKYRLGSGDSGTLKKFRHNGSLLADMGFQPLCLLAREDNLPHAIAALQSGGWMIKTGAESFGFIQEQTGFDLRAFLIEQRGQFQVNRDSNAV